MTKTNSAIKEITWIIPLWIREPLSVLMTINMNLEGWVGIRGKK